MIYFFLSLAFLLLINWPRGHIRFVFYSLILVASCFVVSLITVPDYYEYLSIYQKVPQFSVRFLFGNDSIQAYVFGSSGFGSQLFLFIISLFKSLDLSFSFFRLAIICFLLISLMIFGSNFSPDVRFFLFIYFLIFFYVDSYLLRQSLSLSFLILALTFYFRRRLIFASLFSTISVFIHSSSLFLVLLVVIYKILGEPKIKLRYVVISLSFSVAFSFLDISQVIMNITAGFSDVAESRKLIRYSDSVHGESVGLLRGSLFIYLHILCLFLFLYDEEKVAIKLIQPYRYITFLAVMSLCVLISFSSFGVLSDRLFRLMTFSLVVLITLSTKILVDKKLYFFGTVNLFFIISMACLMSMSNRMEFL